MGMELRKTSQRQRSGSKEQPRKGYLEAEYMMGQLFQNGWGVRVDGLKGVSMVQTSC